MTLGQFRKWTRELPDSATVGYHAYDKGLSLGTFDAANCWLYRRRGDIVVVMNPGDDYDERRPKVGRA
jgi:hypothetical protein